MDTFYIFTFIAVVLILALSFFLFKRKTSNASINVPYDASLAATEATEVEESLAELVGKELIFRTAANFELIFTPPSEISEKQYMEIPLGTASNVSSHLVQGALPFVSQVHTMSEIAKQAPYGLFTATADPSTLSHFLTDGTFTTMVRDSGNHLVSHAGFKQINISGFNPTAVVSASMQAMSMISGQYYLDGINKQLRHVNIQLEDLIEFHHDEKLGDLNFCRNRLEIIAQRSIVDFADIEELQTLRSKTGPIFKEYWTRLKRKQKILLQTVPDGSGTKTQLDSYISKIDEINAILQVCIEAERLTVYTDIAEIAVRMRLNPNDPKVPQLLAEIDGQNKDSISLYYYKMATSLDKELYATAEGLLGNRLSRFLYKKRNASLLSEVSVRINNFSTHVDHSQNPLLAQFVDSKHLPQHILLVPGDNTENPRLFLSVEE